MRVLVTRPRDDAQALTVELERRGHQVVQVPLLDIRYLPSVDVSLDGAQAVLLTSANGARALAQANGHRGMPVFAVGDVTAQKARALGFSVVSSASGDVAKLAAQVGSDLDPAVGPLVHVSGRQVAGDLAGSLGSRGFTVTRVELYEAVAATAIDPAVKVELCEGRIDAVLFFSPRTAHTFVSLIRQARMEKACETLDAICLSNAIAAELDAIPWRCVTVAAHTDQSSLLTALEEEAKNRS